MEQTASSRSNSLSALAPMLGIILLGRIAINMAHRIVYPFLPAIAIGLGVSLETAGFLVALRGLAGLVAPLAGPLAFRFGRRRVMEGGLLLMGLGSLLIPLTSGLFVAAALAFILIGASKSFYDPAMQAYLSDRIPYQVRGRVLAITELSWSSSWLIGVPVTGFLMERIGWQVPWLGLVALALMGWILTASQLPRARITPAAAAAQQQVGGGQGQTSGGGWFGMGGPNAPNPFRQWGQLLRQGQVLVALLVGFSLTVAIDLIVIIYGAWLSGSFGLNLETLGIASVVVGIAEILGESGAAGFVDRLGKRRSVMGGLLVLGISFLVLPRLGGSLPITLGGVMVMMAAFEFSLVSFIPLMSELRPAQRDNLLSLNVAALSLAHMAGAALGSLLWGTYHAITVNALVAAGFVVISILALWYTPEGSHETHNLASS